MQRWLAGGLALLLVLTGAVLRGQQRLTEQVQTLRQQVEAVARESRTNTVARRPRTVYLPPGTVIQHAPQTAAALQYRIVTEVAGSSRATAAQTVSLGRELTVPSGVMVTQDPANPARWTARRQSATPLTRIWLAVEFGGSHSTSVPVDLEPTG